MSEKTHSVPHDELLQLKECFDRILNPIVHWNEDRSKMDKAEVTANGQQAAAGLAILDKYLEEGA